MPVTIVTGGAGGIGRVLVSALRADGPVASLDRVASADAGESYEVDVADESAVGSRIAGLAERHGGVAGLVCAAGIVEEHPVASMPLAAWHRVIDASLTGAFLAIRAVLPSMIAARRGSIVAFSSGYATSGYRNGANYAAAKAGVEALVKSTALENAAYGIRANAIAPGPIATPMLTDERAAVVTPLVPLGRTGVPDDLVGLVRLLLGENAGFITGQTIHVNGGLFMR